MKSYIKLAAIITTLIGGSASNALAQVDGDIYRYNDLVEVTQNSKQLAFPWAGGLNNPQFAMADINQDNMKDIVIYEEYIGVRTFLYLGNGVYKYDPGYEHNFPPMVSYMKLVDYNRDGISDLVHRGAAGFEVYRGYFKNGALNFQFYKELRYDSPNSGSVNAYTGPVDLPDIIDIDEDGDLDFFGYDVFGAYISFYKNCQVENQLPPDSIKICLTDNCWGKTLQLYEREQVLHNSCSQLGTTKCKGCENSPGSANKTTHAGNTICILDYDGDNDFDLLNGNVSFSDIQYLINGKVNFGFTIDSMVEQDTIWGSNGVDMYMPQFPMAFWLDLDQDSNKDLVFSPRTQNTENYKCASFYKNLGTNQSPNFTFQKNTYMVDDMIDIGYASYPVFYDYDKDGKKDLFVGSDGYYDTSISGSIRAKISYYKNTSSGNNTSFYLITDDFLNISTQGYNGAALAFGDLDNDGKDDMVIGHTDGTISFYRNSAASATIQPQWQLLFNTILENNNATLDVGDFAAPCIYDMNKDGKNDLIVGNQLGDLYYFQNDGTLPSTVIVKQVTTNLGGVKVSYPNNIYGYTVPYIGKMDNTNTDYLVVGTIKGYIQRYTGFQSGNISGNFTKVDSIYSYINVSSRATVAFANIDNDPNNMYELVVGNELGGLKSFKQAFPVSISSIGNDHQTDIKVYPNPVSDVVNITWPDEFKDGDVEVSIISVTGQKLLSSTYSSKVNTAVISTSGLASGVYYCIVRSGDQKQVVPISIVR